MIKLFCSDNNALCDVHSPCNDVWVMMIQPSEEELLKISSDFGVDQALLRAATDEDERARIEFFDESPALILVDLPVSSVSRNEIGYETIPLGIVLAKNAIITVCMTENTVLNAFASNSISGFNTSKRSRFVLQILYKTASLYLVYLRQIDKRQRAIEHELRKTMRNSELVSLLSIEKSLVYFSTSLKSNELVLEKLFKNSFMKKYPDDADLLEDVIVENRQAIETAKIYSDILSSTMNAFSSIISNTLNLTMKRLTSITIVLSLPMIISGIWGMNVPVPFEHTWYGFAALFGFTALICGIVTTFMIKKKMF